MTNQSEFFQALTRAIIAGDRQGFWRINAQQRLDLQVAINFIDPISHAMASLRRRGGKRKKKTRRKRRRGGVGSQPTTPRKGPHKKPPLPLKRPKITFWEKKYRGENEEGTTMNVMQHLTSMDLNDKEAEKEILEVLKYYLNDYKRIPENQQDPEFKKNLEKDVTIFQNYVNNQSGGKRRKKKTRKKRGGCWPNCFKKKSNSNSGEFAKTKPPQEQEQEMPLIEQPNQQVRRRRLLRIPSMATLSEGKEKVENWQRSRSTSPTMDPFTAAHHNLPRDHFAKVDEILKKAAKKGLGGGRRKKKTRKRRG